MNNLIPTPKENEVVIFAPYLTESVKIVHITDFEIEMEKTALEFGNSAVGLMVLHGFKWKDIKKTVGSGQFLMACAIKNNTKYGYFGYYHNGAYAMTSFKDIGKTVGERIDRISRVETGFAKDPEFQSVYTLEQHINRIKHQIEPFPWSKFFMPNCKSANPHDFFRLPLCEFP